MNIKEIAKAFGLPTAAVAFVVSIYAIGTIPIYGDLPIAQYWHKHFVDAVMKPSPMDLALNSKGDIQEIVYGYEYSLDKHINKLDDIKARYKDNPTELMIELERWKADKKKIENKLQDWRKKATENRSEIEVMIAKRV